MERPPAHKDHFSCHLWVLFIHRFHIHTASFWLCQMTVHSFLVSILCSFFPLSSCLFVPPFQILSFKIQIINVPLFHTPIPILSFNYSPSLAQFSPSSHLFSSTTSSTILYFLFLLLFLSFAYSYHSNYNSLLCCSFSTFLSIIHLFLFLFPLLFSGKKKVSPCNFCFSTVPSQYSSHSLPFPFILFPSFDFFYKVFQLSVSNARFSSSLSLSLINFFYSLFLFIDHLLSSFLLILPSVHHLPVHSASITPLLEQFIYHVWECNNRNLIAFVMMVQKKSKNSI